MKKLLMAIGLLLVVSPLMGANCNAKVVRDEAVYQTELDFMEQTAKQPAAKLVDWINLNCQCVDGKFPTPLCESSAKLVQVITARVPWHKAMMLYNASILEKRPPKEPPMVPAATDLCPQKAVTP